MIDLSQFQNFTFYNSKEEIVKPTSKWLFAVGMIGVLDLNSPTNVIEAHSEAISKILSERETDLKNLKPVIGCSISVCGTQILGAIFVGVDTNLEIKYLKDSHNKVPVNEVRSDGVSETNFASPLYFLNPESICV